MPKITRKQIAEALQGSVKKWERIVRSTKAKDRGSLNCPLCVLFEDIDGTRNCMSCPIKQDGCENTPYTEWRKHKRGYHGDYFYMNYSSLSRTPHCPDCLRLAKEELAFLKSLKV